MPGRTCSYIPVIPAPPSNRLRVGDPYRPSLQASFDGRVRCHYGITAGCATLGGARLLSKRGRWRERAWESCMALARLALAREGRASAPLAALARPGLGRGRRPPP